MNNLPAYAKKSDAELHYILRDAGEAALNMRAIGDAVAEAKYLDQINDASTILAARRTAGLTRKAAKPAASKDWRCNECGKRMTLRQAERAFSNVQGCPKCGGADIELVR